jgi:hypothetical protein
MWLTLGDPRAFRLVNLMTNMLRARVGATWLLDTSNGSRHPSGGLWFPYITASLAASAACRSDLDGQTMPQLAALESWFDRNLEQRSLYDNDDWAFYLGESAANFALLGDAPACTTAGAGSSAGSSGSSSAPSTPVAAKPAAAKPGPLIPAATTPVVATPAPAVAAPVAGVTATAAPQAPAPSPPAPAPAAVRAAPAPTTSAAANATANAKAKAKAKAKARAKAKAAARAKAKAKARARARAARRTAAARR